MEICEAHPSPSHSKHLSQCSGNTWNKTNTPIQCFTNNINKT